MSEKSLPFTHASDTTISEPSLNPRPRLSRPKSRPLDRFSRDLLEKLYTFRKIFFTFVVVNLQSKGGEEGEEEFTEKKS
jgi:hypothetical protein